MTEKTKELKEVTIYTDGGCDPNPGPGGYGVVLIHNQKRKEISGGFRLSTNNRMEVYAAIAGLETLKVPCKVQLYSDSRYLVDAVSKSWVLKWKQNGWMRNKDEKALNIDLWEKLLLLLDKHKVEFKWVKGHAGNEENERCDQLSNEARKNPDLPVDEGYIEQERNNKNIKITAEGQPCRKCSTPVVKKNPRKKRKPGQSYYYEYYFECPNCKTIYFVDEAKKYFQD